MTKQLLACTLHRRTILSHFLLDTLKHHILSVLLMMVFSVVAYRLSAQINIQPVSPPPTSYQCGVIEKLAGIPDGYTGQILYDRFGNTWTVPEIQALSANSTTTCNAGVFEIQFTDVPAVYQATICEVFEYVSSTIGGGSGAKVPISVVWMVLEERLGGEATSFHYYSSCNRMENTVLQGVRGINNTLPIGTIAGLVRINSTVNWYNGPASGITNGTIDLYTVVLHEVLHLLGIASMIGDAGNPANPAPHYTEYDRYLAHKSGITTYDPLLVNVPDATCCSKMVDNPNSNPNLLDDCDGDIFFTNSAGAPIAEIVEVAYIVNGQAGVTNIPNKLSHFDISCSNSAYQYVMHPSIGVYPDAYSTPRRTITPPELEVLCRIGYPAAGSCNDCALSVYDDYVTDLPVFLFNADGSPNLNPFIRLDIDLDYASSFYNLIKNDITPNVPDAIFEIITSHPGLTITTTDIDPGTPGYLTVTVTDNTPGIKTFQYSLTVCGQCQYGTVYIQVVERPLQLTCEGDLDCNLVCFGDFEDIPCVNTGPGSYPFGYNLFGYAGTVSTPDVVLVGTPGGATKVLSWRVTTNGGGVVEIPRIPLSQPIYPGCTATVSLRATASNMFLTPLGNLELQIFGITDAPCPVINELVWGGTGSSFELCSSGGNTVNAICMGIEPNLNYEDDYQLTSDGICNRYDDMTLVPYTFEFSYNPQGPSPQPIKELLILGKFTVPGGVQAYTFLLDDLYVTSDCNNQISVTPTVIQEACSGGQAILKYKVCLQGDGPIAPVQLQASVPPAYQPFVSFAPAGGFDANGLATFNLTPGADCNSGNNTTTLILTANIAPNILPGTVIDIDMSVLSGNTCLNGSASDGDIKLIVQDCNADPTACPCTAANSINIGNNTTSFNYISNFISSPELVGGCISVNGKLVINEDCTLNNCTVVMNKGAEIEIQGSKLLRLTNGTSLYGCNHMWKGITVLEQGKLYVEGTATAKVSISDAQYAVKPLNGSEIKLVHAIFDKNYVDFHASSNANLIAVTLESIANCSFTASGALKPAYNGQSPVPGTSPYAAFNLKNVTGINFGSKAPNTIDRHRFGLRADRSSFSMSNTTMSDFVGGNSDKIGVYANLCANAKVKDCNIKDYIQGVKSIRSNTEVTGTRFNFETPSTISTIGIEIQAGTGKVTKIQSNIIERSGFGIKIIESYGYNGSDVYNNIIRNFYIPTGLPGIPSAIDLNTVTNFSISTNYIGDGSTGDNHTGITMYRCIENFVVSNTINSMMRGISNNSGLLNYFQENTIQKALIGNDLPGEGFYVSGSTDGYCYNTTRNLTKDGYSFVGGCDPSIVAQSQIYGAQTGLRIFENNSAIGVQNNHKNRWFGPFSGGFGAFHESGDFAVIDASKFLTQQILIPTWNSNAGNIGISWFEAIPNDPPGVPPTCSDYPSSGKTSENDGKTAQGDYNGPFADAYTWEARIGLYRRIQADASVINNNTAVASFYQQAADAPVGRFALGRRATHDLLALNNNLRQQFYNGSVQAVTINEQLDAALEQPQPDWATVRSLQLQLRQSTTRFLTLDKGYCQKQTSTLPTVQNLINGLTDAETYQNNEKMVWQFILDEQLWLPEVVPSVTALERLESTAAQCAIAGGNGVYVARSLLLRWGIDRNWDDRELCIVEKERTDNAEPTSGWLVVPNPARDILAFQHSSPLIEEGQITVFNTLGAMVLQTTIAEGQRQVTIPVQNWANGLYYYQITGNNKSSQNGIFIIQH